MLPPVRRARSRCAPRVSRPGPLTCRRCPANGGPARLWARATATAAATAMLTLAGLILLPAANATAASHPGTKPGTTASRYQLRTLYPMANSSPLCLLRTPPAGLCATSRASATAESSGGPSAPAMQQPRSAQSGSDAWAIVNSPDLPGAWRSSLTGSACLSAADCWAVGEQRSPDDYSSSLAEHWDGRSWTIATTPTPPATLNSALFNVSCPAASDCWAVGYYSLPGGHSAPLGEHWDGASWSIDDLPVPAGTPYAGLQGVTCTSVSDCWSVGFYYDNGNFAALIDSWDGTTWSIIASPASAGASQGLQSVDCVSPSDCWAVGNSSAGPGAPQALIENWNGSTWTASQPATLSGAQSAELAGVSCTSTALCWAVGDYELDYAGVAQALIEEWNGTSWTAITPSKALPLSAASLAAVTCISSTDCLAAGSTTPPGGSQEPLVQA